MRHAIALIALALASPLASATPTANPPPATPARPATPAKAADALLERATLVAPIQVESLTLTPIIAKAVAKDEPQLIVLDEAMPKKLVRITERDGGDVNNLTLTNKADRPLFLLAGEVILGGKQDRIIGRNTVVPAKTTQEVPVFCVEHGRWQGVTGEFTTAKALAHGRLRERANFEAQQDVWDEVAAKNQARKTETDTGTYRKVATQQHDGTLASWQKQVDAGLAKLPADQQHALVGFAVAVNGKVAGVDVFQSPALFAKLRGKLVQSYITEAIDVARAKDAKPPTAADVQTFIRDAESAKEEGSYETDLATTKVKKGHFAAKAGVMYKPAAAPAAAPGAARTEDDKAVYEGYYAR